MWQAKANDAVCCIQLVMSDILLVLIHTSINSHERVVFFFIKKRTTILKTIKEINTMRVNNHHLLQYRTSMVFKIKS